jgi:hypothetical protein
MVPGWQERSFKLVGFFRRTARSDWMTIRIQACAAKH